MDWDAKRFYQELDQRYSRGLEEVERFLLESRGAFRETENAAGLVAVHNELGSFYRGPAATPNRWKRFKRPGRRSSAVWVRTAWSLPRS